MLSDIIKWGKNDKLDKMCHLVTEQYMREEDGLRLKALLRDGCPEKCGYEGIGGCVHEGEARRRIHSRLSFKYQEKSLRRWLLKRYPTMTKELREDVCECAVQNYAFERSDPRKYS